MCRDVLTMRVTRAGVSGVNDLVPLDKTTTADVLLEVCSTHVQHCPLINNKTFVGLVTDVDLVRCAEATLRLLRVLDAADC